MQKNSRTRKLLTYVIINGIFAGCLIGGMFFGINILLNIGIGIALVFSGLTGMLYLCLLIPSIREDVLQDAAKKGFSDSSVPQWVDFMYDLCIIGLFVYFSYLWIAVAYASHLYCTCDIRAKIKQIKLTAT